MQANSVNTIEEERAGLVSTVTAGTGLAGWRGGIGPIPRTGGWSDNYLRYTTNLAAEKAHHPMVSRAASTREWGTSRVFVSTVGHGVEAFDDPHVCTISERGPLWASS